MIPADEPPHGHDDDGPWWECDRCTRRLRSVSAWSSCCLYD